MTALTVTEVKNYLRYEEEDDYQDTALGIILGAAQRWVEEYTGHILVQRIVTETPLAFEPFHTLRYKPYVADSMEISYLDGSFEAVEDYADFTVYQGLGGHRLITTSAWPATTGGIVLTYMAGYEDAYDVPDDLMHAVAVYAAAADEGRADMGSGGIPTGPALNSGVWKTLTNMLAGYRLPTLA